MSSMQHRGRRLPVAIRIELIAHHRLNQVCSFYRATTEFLSAVTSMLASATAFIEACETCHDQWMLDAVDEMAVDDVLADA